MVPKSIESITFDSPLGTHIDYEQNLQDMYLACAMGQFPCLREIKITCKYEDSEEFWCKRTLFTHDYRRYKAMFQQVNISFEVAFSITLGDFPAIQSVSCGYCLCGRGPFCVHDIFRTQESFYPHLRGLLADYTCHDGLHFFFATTCTEPPSEDEDHRMWYNGVF
ncbi:hypothetical protein BDV95DRAFT_607124 [Massariosphaeria phaeospora]|uniref:Uncharacterized protein n=1 Tax=Massariosphaeria phaeospora TaxID=100035 RepID=A0A7C8I839_9PLEO|nr:hypothetical protein BDV95DRAFT_607124 [Massariosphaeria phaeospora]